MTERFGLARRVEVSSIFGKAAFRAHRRGGMIRRLTAFCLFKTRNCGSERRRECCVGMELRLPRQVYLLLFAMSRCFLFFAIGTRISGLARVADCFDTTR